MLAHIVYPDIHKLAGIKGTSTKMWRGSSMCCLSGKGKINPCVRKRVTVLDSVKCRGMPRYGRAYIIKKAVTCHIGFCSAAFFRRAPIVTDTRLYPIFGQPVLDSSCGQKRRGAKKIMATSVTVTAFGNWFVFGNSRFLAEAGKGIEFA